MKQLTSGPQTTQDRRQQLEFQADRIETVFSQHNIRARVTGGTVTPRWVHFQVIPAIGQRLSTITGLSQELAAAMQADNCRIQRRGAAVVIEIPRNDPQPVRLLPLYDQLMLQAQSLSYPANRLAATMNTPGPQPIPPATAILGLAEDGAPLLLRLPSPDVAHVLVAGTTGSGKTVLVQTIALSLAMTNPSTDLRMVHIDGGRSAFTAFEGLRHLAMPVVTDNQQVPAILTSLVHELDRRTADNLTTPTIVVIVDELADLLMVGGQAATWALTRLTQRGRGAGIHIVAATQKPTAAVLGPLVKANFPVRLVGRVTSIEDARTATGWGGTGAERLQGHGDFLAVAEGQVTHFQAAHITGSEIRQVISRMPHVHDQAEPLFQKPDTTPIEVAASPDPDQVLASKLRASDLWANRKDPSRNGYRWGFIGDVCRDLLGQEAEGSWYRRAARILAIAEQRGDDNG